MCLHWTEGEILLCTGLHTMMMSMMLMMMCIAVCVAWQAYSQRVWAMMDATDLEFDICHRNATEDDGEENVRQQTDRQTDREREGGG